MARVQWLTSNYITDWIQFASQVRSQGCQLLKRLDNYPNSILVAGCQRSGTTMLSRILTQSDSLINYWFGPDDELDAALILSGYVNLEPEGRHCFQTTYVNECYTEYYEHSEEHKIIWVIRNPYSVVYSMLYNWSDFGINEIFTTCSVSLLTGRDKWLYQTIGLPGITRLRRACWAYVGKTRQIFELQKHLSSNRLMILDYDDMVTNKAIVLPQIFEFIDLTYKEKYLSKIRSGSLKKSNNLTKSQTRTIRVLCEPIYREAKKLITQ